MSPTVPPISTMVTSAPLAETLRMAFLISLVTCGNDLDGLAQVVAAPLFQNDLLVDAAGGEVVVARQRRMGEALVVAQVEVGLGAVVGDKDFAVLEGRHGSRIDVEIGVELHHVHAQAAALKQAADGGRRQTLA